MRIMAMRFCRNHSQASQVHLLEMTLLRDNLRRCLQKRPRNHGDWFNRVLRYFVVTGKASQKYGTVTQSVQVMGQGGIRGALSLARMASFCTGVCCSRTGPSAHFGMW